MACPFPGMDPFLEIPPFWSDFSPAFLTAIRNRLISQVLPKYEVRVEEYLLLEHEDSHAHRLKPDVVISSNRQSDAISTANSLGSVAVVVSEAAYPDFDPVIQRRLILLNRGTGQVVTVMEVLSPINKTPGRDGIDAYQRKREEILMTTCHLVELDLLRGGERLPIKGSLPPGDYFAYIGRSERRPNCQIIGWEWRSPLPTVPIPLLPEDGEVPLDLAATFQDAYEPAYYHQRLPYDSKLNPPLTEEEQEWVGQQFGSSD